MGLQKGKGTTAGFVAWTISEAEPTSITLIQICTFCLVLSESDQGWQRSLNQDGMFDPSG